MASLAKPKGFTHESSASKSVDWYTPPWVFEMLGVVFDLDPCHPEKPIPWLPAKRRFTLADDGLQQPWEGRVWLNPPYGKAVPEWLSKMNLHRDGIALLFARTDCAWFHDLVTQADAVLFVRGRIHFVDGLCKTRGNGPGNGSMLVAWGLENVATLQRVREREAI